MATTVTVTSAFKGLPAGEIIGQIFKEANSIKDGLITVIPNIVGSGFMRKTYVTDGLQDYSCGFDASGAVDLTEKEIITKKLKVNLEICKESFRQRWSASQMGFSAWNDQIPADEEEALLLDLANGLAAKIESQIWTGVAANNGEFGGLIPQWTADATVIDVAGVLAITPANVVAEMGKTLDATPDEVISHPSFKFVVARNVFRAYTRALNSINSNWAADAIYFDGYRVDVANGMPTSYMATYPAANVALLTGLESDFNEVRIKDMDDTTLDGTIRIGVQFTAATGYADGSDIVLYAPVV